MVAEAVRSLDDSGNIDLHLFVDFDFKEYFDMITEKELKAARIAKAPYLSKKEFAGLAGVDQASICRWERGKIPKTSGIFRKYLIFLGLLETSE